MHKIRNVVNFEIRGVPELSLTGIYKFKWNASCDYLVTLLESIEFWFNWHWPELYCLLHWGTKLYPKHFINLFLKEIDKKQVTKKFVKKTSNNIFHICLERQNSSSTMELLLRLQMWQFMLCHMIPTKFHMWLLFMNAILFSLPVCWDS